MMGRKILRSKILLMLHEQHFPLQGRRIQRGHLCLERTGKSFILTCSVISHKRNFSKVSVLILKNFLKGVKVDNPRHSTRPFKHVSAFSKPGMCFRSSEYAACAGIPSPHWRTAPPQTTSWHTDPFPMIYTGQWCQSRWVSWSRTFSWYSLLRIKFKYQPVICTPPSTSLTLSPLLSVLCHMGDAAYSLVDLFVFPMHVTLFQLLNFRRKGN